LQNLIDNGIKYHGPESPRIHISAGKRDGEWVFSVRDNGIGIAEKHWERVFDIFHRLHTQQQYPGTGIGLAVCRRVIHRHGGRIWIESEPGRGSTVYFTLPDRGKETESSPGSACQQ
jgi:chemotaxis family two-component system sensor kinase Cph1